jgi:2-haloacid dehalogenase
VRPRLFTFDIFGTVLDWRRGLTEALGRTGITLDADSFDRVIDVQAELESGPFRTYAEIVARSLVVVLGVKEDTAALIGREAGTWPLFPDSRDALRRLRALAPCVATTNSDRAHGDQVQGALGFRLDAWICAEETGIYKPDPRVWHAASARTGVPPGPWWWHVSAYGDYDLATARSLGLTCVYVSRAHARPGSADLAVAHLGELAERAEATASAP